MKIRRPGTAVALSVLLTVLASTAVAGESEDEKTHATTGQEGHGGGGHEFQHEISLFLGFTDEEGHSAEGTIGFEYAYTLYPRWAVGGLIDYAGGDVRNLVLGAPVYFRPGRGWVLLAAPGVEFHNGWGGETAGHGEADEDETDFLFRVGVMYKFRISERFSILPTLDVDFVGGDTAYVYGANFAFEFGK